MRSTEFSGTTHRMMRSAPPSPQRRSPRSSSVAAIQRPSSCVLSMHPAFCSPASSRPASHGASSREATPTVASSLPSPGDSVPGMPSSISLISAIGGLVHLPRIAVTIGDPAGVGAEIALKAFADRELLDLAHWIVIGDHVALDAAQPGYRDQLDPRVRLLSPDLLDPAAPICFGELSAE